MKIKLLALDLDDTCLNWRNQITPATLQALKRAAESGIEIVFVTGRAYDSFPHQLRGETFFRYVITSNGACVVDTREGRTIYERGLPRHTAVRLLERAREVGLGLTVHADHHYLVEGRRLMALGRLLYGQDSYAAIRKRDVIAHVSHQAKRIEELHLFCFRRRKRRQIAALRQSFPELHAPANAFCVEFVAGDVSKGSALRWLCTRLGIEKREVACVGDGENDLPMFAQAGLRFAMGNGQPRLKEKAHAVLPSNNRDGVCAAVRRIEALNARHVTPHFEVSE